MAIPIEQAADQARLLGRRNGDVDHFHRRIVEHLVERLIDLGHAPKRSHFARLSIDRDVIPATRKPAR